MTLLLQRTPVLRRWLPLAVVLLLAAGTWTATNSRAATHTVDIRDFAFSPAEMTIAVGDTVTWVNHDSEAHAVQGGPFNSPDIPPGGSWSYTFGEAGDVSYICRIHTYMSGVVHVTAGGGGPSTTTTTTVPPSTTTTTAPSTTTTAPPGSTTTTAPDGGSTTTTTAPDGGSTTTTTAPPATGSAGFQDVPDDPSAGHPPGTPGASQPPPATAPQSTTTTTAPPATSPGEQDVPDDPSAGHHPGEVTAQQADGLGDGTVLAPYTVDGGVKVFHLTMAPTTIEVEPGVTKQAYVFNGVVPGPVLRVNEGDRVRIIVENHLPFPTSTHWHGMILPNDQDGVGGITQPDIEPGGQHTYEWTALAPGTHWYHTHSSGRHIGKGLYGPLEVVPSKGDIKADHDYRLMLGDTDLGFVINGRSFPSTPTFAMKLGETVRFRIINAGDQVHAMHLHGIPFKVVAQDGNPLPAPLTMDTLSVAPAQTFDIVAKPVNPGKWLLHCHVFAHSHMSMDTHPAGQSGMTGMVTILDVASASSSSPPSSLLPGLNISAHGDRASLDAHEVLAVVTVVGLVLTFPTRRRRRLSLPPRKDQTR